MGTFESDMVTYRVKTGENAGELFTRVDMQLEAYCSGMGKVLLAFLPAAERAAYLAGGPFVELTPTTITDPQDLARELARVGQQGFAEDRGETVPDLFCLAVPIRRPDGSVPAAISVSRLAASLGARRRKPRCRAAGRAGGRRAPHRADLLCRRPFARGGWPGRSGC
jgi:DNA-binding IclR family transcriptional regulator